MASLHGDRQQGFKLKASSALGPAEAQFDLHQAHGQNMSQSFALASSADKANGIYLQP